jgi:hypothetical protein
MLRLRLGVDDLARMTFAAPTPFCELAVSAQVLQQPASHFRRLWRARRARIPAPAGRLVDLVPAYGSVPTFLAPESCSCLDEALDVVQSTPASMIRAELAEMPWSSGPSPWVRDLARGRVDALAELGWIMRIYHDNVMAPVWPTVGQVVTAELRDRAWQLATEGADATLNSLHPRIRWRDGVLEVAAPTEADIDLAGRGLRLMPSVWTRPAVAVAGRSRPLSIRLVPRAGYSPAPETTATTGWPQYWERRAPGSCAYWPASTRPASSRTRWASALHPPRPMPPPSAAPGW